MKQKTPSLLRWPGGKRQLLPAILPLLPRSFAALHEPFAGGAALSFALKPLGYYLSDVNEELINLYTEIKHRPGALLKHLRAFPLNRETFVALRRVDRDSSYPTLSPAWRAARYLFLNRTCFNGLMRVTASGHQSCSVGKPWRAERIFDDTSVWATHEALRTCRLSHTGYSDAFSAARSDDFIFIDPPYVPIRPAGDIAYTGSTFTLNDQGRLANLCGRLTRRGVKWMLCNSDASFIRRLYGHYKIHEVTARRSLSGSAAARGKARELIVTNY